MEELSKRLLEFEENIWNHAADPFQAQFDQRRPLAEDELALLNAVHAATLIASDDEALAALRRALLARPAHLATVLQIGGLTRTKIITDLKAGAPASTKIPSDFTGITKDAPWPFAGPYLLARLRAVLANVSARSASADAVFEALNQATWPGFIRQERAKRSGHEAEKRLAILFATMKIPFEPEAKSENPLCPDAMIGGVSFDLVVPNVKRPVLVVKATVHTAAIGQYGESKDNLEVREAKEYLDGHFRRDRPLLLALVDGVGFRSNRAGLSGVLSTVDEFCQFRTIWKAVLLAGLRTGNPIEVALEHNQSPSVLAFLERHKAQGYVRSAKSVKSALGWTPAGDALIRRKN